MRFSQYRIKIIDMQCRHADAEGQRKHNTIYAFHSVREKRRALSITTKRLSSEE